MTRKEFERLTKEVNDGTFFDKQRGTMIFLEPMFIFLSRSITPIQGDYFVGVKNMRTISLLNEGAVDVSKVEQVRINFKSVQRLRGGRKFQRNITKWNYVEPTPQEIRRKKLDAIRRVKL
jgi:hypothetical protein